VAAVTRITIKQEAVADHLAMVHSALVAGKPRDGTCESSAVLAFNVNEVHMQTENSLTSAQAGGTPSTSGSLGLDPIPLSVASEATSAGSRAAALEGTIPVSDGTPMSEVRTYRCSYVL
jgi:hypothetical protein